MNAKQYYVYILTNQKSGTLYIGVTNDLKRRVHQHREKQNNGFTERYNVSQLVYYETGAEILSVIQREKQLKHWKREWKIQLIEKANPKWRDLLWIFNYPLCHPCESEDPSESESLNRSDRSSLSQG